MTNKKHLFLLIFIFMFGINLAILRKSFYETRFLKEIWFVCSFFIKAYLIILKIHNNVNLFLVFVNNYNRFSDWFNF